MANPQEQCNPNHRCSLCGLPGFPSEFSRTKTGNLSSQCKECTNRMAAYRAQARSEGRVLAPLEHRAWWKPAERDFVEQRLCWAYIDVDMSEEAWLELCDQEAGSINTLTRVAVIGE